MGGYGAKHDKVKKNRAKARLRGEIATEFSRTDCNNNYVHM
jgi:hypothetical protein